MKVAGFFLYLCPDQLGPAPVSTHWTVLCLDLQQILSTYLNRRYAYLKSIRLCANLTVRNVFTSDTLYQPGKLFFQTAFPLIIEYFQVSDLLSWKT